MSESALTRDGAWLLIVIVVVLVLAAAFLATRRFALERGGGTVECGLRRPGRNRGRWRLGVASYQPDELRWYTAFGVTPRPTVTFPRRDLAVLSRRIPDPAEAASLGPGRVVVQCRLTVGETVELALHESALTGLLAWLESGPPGSHVGWPT